MGLQSVNAWQPVTSQRRTIKRLQEYPELEVVRQEEPLVL
jgi:hypothetical protein